MTLQELINLAGDRDLAKSFPKADGFYIWDYKLIDMLNLELIPSNSGKAGFQDKVSIQELVDYVIKEGSNSTIKVSLEEVRITGVEEITLAKI